VGVDGSVCATGASRAEGRDGRDDTRGHPRRASRVTRPHAMRDARLRGGGVCHHDRRCCDGAVTLCRRPAEQGGGLFTAKKLSGSSFTGGSRQRRGFIHLAHVTTGRTIFC
jgi:hypothetical protein